MRPQSVIVPNKRDMSTMNPFCFRLLCAAMLGVTAIMPVTTTAAETEDDRLQTLLEELKAHIERAEQQRLADPWLLRDLRDLVSNYENPWRNEILHDDFSTKAHTPSDPWKTTAGEFLIDWRYGLRSVVEPSRQQAQTRREGKEMEELFGALLEQMLGNGETDRDAGADSDYAVILAPVPFSNAFAIDIELSSRDREGPGVAFEWGPYQGEDVSAGYRLVYTPNPEAGLPSLALRRYSTRGASTLEYHDQPIDLQDGQTHNLRWTRDTNGQMTVHLDGEQVIQIRDRGFQQSFDGFAMINQGGDYAVREITIMGTD